MSDNNAHPGVRSLLAKFENSPSQVTSPPSRGRSPDSSDTPGSTRQLSRVRASFVTVDGVVQSNPGSPLRKTSGRSDSPGMFGPKINEQDVEGRRQNVASPTPAGLDDGQESVLDQVANAVQPAPTSTGVTKNDVKEELVATVDTTTPVKETPPTLPAKIDNTPAVPAPAASVKAHGVSEKPPTKTITKRPSTINATKPSVAHKSPPATSTATKQPATVPTKPAREMAKERASTLTSKPSRASLNPSAKTAPRTTRGSTPSQEPSKSSPPGSAKSRPKSPTKPVRLPPSMTAQTQSSSAKTGSGAQTSGRVSTTASTLTRKPSSLRSAAGPGQSRSTVGTTAGLRHQSSRPSLPVQPAQERPSSRTSDVGSTTRPVNEGFLARMMRPTASSASKTHERPDAKPSQKPVTTPKPSRPSMGRAPERSAQPKPKATALRPQKSQAFNKEPVPKKESKETKATQPEQESEKENIEDSTPAIPEEPEVIGSNDDVVHQSEVEAPVIPAADAIDGNPVKNIDLEAAAEQVKPTTVESPAEVPIEAPVEPVKAAADNEAPESWPQSIEKSNSVKPSTAVSTEPEPEPDNVVLEESSVSDMEVSTETPAEVNGVERFETQTESPEDVYQTPVDSTDENDTIAVARTEDPATEDLKTPEVSQSYDAPIDKSAEVVAETKKNIIAPETLEKPEEEHDAKDSTAAQEPAKGTGKNVDEIDFVSLALN